MSLTFPRQGRMSPTCPRSWRREGKRRKVVPGGRYPCVRVNGGYPCTLTVCHGGFPFNPGGVGRKRKELISPTIVTMYAGCHVHTTGCGQCQCQFVAHQTCFPSWSEHSTILPNQDENIKHYVIFYVLSFILENFKCHDIVIGKPQEEEKEKEKGIRLTNMRASVQTIIYIYVARWC